MSNRGQSQYLRIYDDSQTYVRWQSYYINQTITLDSASWVYNPFNADGMMAGSPAGSDVTITVPATTTAISVFKAALNNNRLCEIKMYEFDTRLSQVAPISTQSLIATYVGEVSKISGNFTQLSVNLSSALSPVGAQVPPRKFTTLLIGAPVRL